MPLVMNASSEEVQVRVHGAWFTFKGKQIKDMHEDKVAFLISNCAHLGFVALPDKLEDLDIRQSPEGQSTIKDAEERGIMNRISYLEYLKQNELVSLQRDIDRSGMKYDARLEMSPEMVKNLQELAGYKRAKVNEAEKKVEQIKEIEALLEK